MTTDRGFSAGRFSRLVLCGFALVTLLACVGYFPTKRLAGDPAIRAMIAGCVIAWIAGCVGGLLAARTGGGGAERVNRILGATAVRLFVAAGLGVAAALSGFFDVRPLLVWVALAYVATLCGETILVVSWAKSDERGERPQPAGEGLETRNHEAD